MHELAKYFLTCEKHLAHLVNDIYMIHRETCTSEVENQNNKEPDLLSLDTDETIPALHRNTLMDDEEHKYHNTVLERE